MESLTIGGGGFLLAVLWFDLMFDVQVRGHRGDVLPDAVLTSIATYYQRVTTDARPMNRFVALGMIVTLGGLAGQLLAGRPALPVVASAAVAVPPIALAGVRVFPAAVRLATRADDLVVQSTLARRIYRDHVFCIVAIATLLVIQGLVVST